MHRSIYTEVQKIYTRAEKDASVLKSRRLPFDRAKTDGAAAEPVRPANAVDRAIGARLRLGDALAQRADVEHAPAIGEHAAALGFGAGVENFHPFHLARFPQTFNPRALRPAAGIAFRRHD